MIAVTRFDLLPEMWPGPCVICKGSRPEYACERCGAPFHADCYWPRVATAWERVEIETVEQDPATLVMFCQGCRS